MTKLRRTEQGIALEQLLHGMKHRYVLCWNGDDYSSWGGAYDCACCITYVGGDDSDVQNCGCNCHWIIEEMATGRYASMWLLALKASKEMPFIPKNYQDWIDHCRPIKQEHDTWRAQGNPGASPEKPEECCEACKLVIQQERLYEEHQTAANFSHCGGGDPSQCHICTAQVKEAKEKHE